MSLSEEEKRLLRQAENVEDELEDKGKKKKKLKKPPFYVVYREEACGLLALLTIVSSVGYLFGPSVVAGVLIFLSITTILICIGSLADRRDSDLDYRINKWKERNKSK